MLPARLWHTDDHIRHQSHPSSLIQVAGDNVISIVAFVLISVFVWVYNKSVAIEREWMRELMAPEVRLGVVAPANSMPSPGRAPG